MKRSQLHYEGFHLIEILIALTIVGILMAISIPNYTQYIIHENRLEAVNALNHLVIAMEHYHFEHNTYANASLQTLHLSDRIANNSYQLTIQSADAENYSLFAQPLGKQAMKDTDCGTLIMRSSGEKNISGEGHIHDCW